MTNETIIDLPSVETEKEAFFKMANIEDYNEFRPVAKKLAEAYFANADFAADDLYNEFDYTSQKFDERMRNIYEAVLPGMYLPHSYDRSIITWRNGAKYRVGKASNKVVKDQLLQLAPFNLMDGVWLQNILQARPSDNVQSKLFSIWSDEVGNGEAQQNHSNVYQNLLRSQGFNLPPVTSREFLDIDVAPGAWRTPVFQMCVGLFPQEYFPELIGMTLFLEWEATPTLMPKVRMLDGRGINPLFYSLHVAIDNISEGHGAIAREAVKIFLEEKREEGGEEAVQQNWKRIWRGYVTWATAGFNGEGLAIRRLLLDKKAINIGTPEAPHCIPDFKEHYRERMVALIRKKAEYASQVHGSISVGGTKLNELFSDPEQLMEKMLVTGYFNKMKPRDSKFFELLEFDGPMYKVFSDEDIDTILDWLESLQTHDDSDCIDPLPEKPVPSNSLREVIEIIKDVAGRAQRAHDELMLPNNSGEPVPINSLFDDPIALLTALVRGGWIIPYAPDRSILVTRLFENSGPMEGEITDNQLESLKRWIQEGALLDTSDSLTDPSILTPSLAKLDREFTMSFSEKRQYIGQGCVH